MINNILTGVGCIDSNLGVGILPDAITLIYGEPETGKSTLAMQCCVNCAMQGLKVLYIDCDNTFSTTRLEQLSYGKLNEIAEFIILMKPTDFNQQIAILDNLTDYIAKNFGLVVIDTFNSLYRAKVAESSVKASFSLNRELNRQMASLAQIAKTQHIPILVTSQVCSIFNNPHVNVAPVAVRVLDFWADATIALHPTENSQIIKVIIEKKQDKNNNKNRNTQEPTCYLRISETGLHDYMPSY
ncbi:MAG: AAA family ATPase [Crenarchaeota archaeon]|nr:AAA family ATPase [Thermoproteota archaeon]